MLKKTLAALGAVLSAFIGIRRRRDAQTDASHSPVHLIIAAILCVAVLVGLLITLVSYIVPK